jgi:acyl dehydratase
VIQASSVAIGDQHELALVDGLTRTQIVQYAGASGDYNPLHSDEAFTANIAGYPTVFAHGMLTMGMTGRLLTDLAGPEGLVSYGARFVAQVWPGDTLTARAAVEAIRTEGGETLVDLALTTVNQRDETVLSGTATVRAAG